MALIHTSICSQALMGETHVNIILPIGTAYDSSIPEGEKFETLWMIHGGGGNCEEWVTNTSIERLAVKHRFACVIPEIGFTDACNIPGGEQYFTYLTEELPRILRKHLPLSEKREDNYFVGLSMGGQVTAKVGFNCPDKYAAIGIMSGGPATPKKREKGELNHVFRGPKLMDIQYGGMEHIPGSMHDVEYILKQAVKNHVELPKIYDCCGTEDFVYPVYCGFKKLAEELKLDVTFEEGPGMHNWDFWDAYLPKFLDWLPLKHRNYETTWNQ